MCVFMHASACMNMYVCEYICIGIYVCMFMCVYMYIDSGAFMCV